MQFVLGVRKIRSGMNIAPGKPLPVLLQHGSEQDRQWLANQRHYLASWAGLHRSNGWRTRKAPESATALVGEMKLLIPMAGLIDKDAEQARLDKELEKKRGELERTEDKLHNASFVDKAPAAVVDKEKAKADELRSAIRQLEEQLAKIAAL